MVHPLRVALLLWVGGCGTAPNETAPGAADAAKDAPMQRALGLAKGLSAAKPAERALALARIETLGAQARLLEPALRKQREVETDPALKTRIDRLLPAPALP